MFVEPLEALGLLAYHRAMLRSGPRLEGYRQAIEETVRPGDVVVDIGTGTGILALFAARAGAKKVYAIESSPSLDLAREICAASAYGDRVELIRGASTHLDIPPVDVIVTDTFGGFGIDEGLLGGLIDARTRWLQPGGAIIPSAVELSVFPVECPDIYDRLFFPQDVEGLSVAMLNKLVVNSLYRMRLDDAVLLAPPQTLAKFNMYEVVDPHTQGRATFRPERHGTMHGVGGWFTTELKPGVSLTTAMPGSSLRWNHAFFPLPQPREVHPGNVIELDIRAASNGTFFRWSVTVDGEAWANQTTLDAWPIDPAQLRALAPGYQPGLTAEGEVMKSALSLLDGTRSSSEIQARLLASWPDFFRTEEQAAAFVRDLVRRYG
ncbi:MAG TPA: 50S ribosomal protein L11 methyltransferase [Actinomycetota bacterium]|nr:50S ribosomal protein L11 methyltransferase [Actinomycetota bacterium]